MNNQRKKSGSAATDSLPRPGNFPLGSMESRAAARLVAERKKAAESLPIITIRVITDVSDGVTISVPVSPALDRKLGDPIPTDQNLPQEPVPAFPPFLTDEAIRSKRAPTPIKRAEVPNSSDYLDSPPWGNSPKPQNARGHQELDWQSEAAREARCIDYGKYLVRQRRMRRQR